MLPYSQWNRLKHIKKSISLDSRSTSKSCKPKSTDRFLRSQPHSHHLRTRSHVSQLTNIQTRSIFGFIKFSPQKPEVDQSTPLQAAIHGPNPNKNMLYLTKSDAEGEYGFYRGLSSTESIQLSRIRTQVGLSRAVEGTRKDSWFSWVLSFFFQAEVRYHLLGDLLYRATKEHCERVEWLETGLPCTFGSWFNVTLIHVWLLLVRLRTIENKQMRQAVSQRVIDNFFLDVERGIVVTANVTNPIIVGKTNKLLLKSYYGAMAALDEAFLKGDAQLADALYRNLYGMDTDRMSAQKLEIMIRYIRRALYKLDNTDHLPYLTMQWKWEEPPVMPDSTRKPSKEPLIKLYDPLPHMAIKKGSQKDKPQDEAQDKAQEQSEQQVNPAGNQQTKQTEAKETKENGKKQQNKQKNK